MFEQSSQPRSTHPVHEQQPGVVYMGATDGCAQGSRQCCQREAADVALMTAAQCATGTCVPRQQQRGCTLEQQPPHVFLSPASKQPRQQPSASRFRFGISSSQRFGLYSRTAVIFIDRCPSQIQRLSPKLAGGGAWAPIWEIPSQRSAVLVSMSRTSPPLFDPSQPPPLPSSVGV